MIETRLEIRDRAGAVVLEDVLAATGVLEGAGLTYTDELCAAGTCEFALPVDAPEVTTANFSEGEREVHVWRDDGSGEEHVWGGELWTSRLQGWEVRFIARGFYQRLSRREVYETYAAVDKDVFDIVRDLVGDAQALTDGDLGITFWSSADMGQTRKLVVCAEQRRKIGDVVEELAGARGKGFEFAVSPDKVMTLWHPRRGLDLALTLEGTDVADFSLERDASDLATEVAGIGPDGDDGCVYLYVVQDAVARARFGLLQDSVDLSHVKEPDQVDGLTDQELHVAAQRRNQPEVTIDADVPGAPEWGAYGVGDRLGVSVRRGTEGGFGWFDGQFRVVSKSTTARRVGRETVVLGLDAGVAA